MGYQHKSVLLGEVLEAFDGIYAKNEAIFVDGTIGLAGHSISIAGKFSAQKKKFRMIAVDKDTQALEIAGDHIRQAGLKEHFTFVHDDFCHFSDILEQLEINKVDGILLDLGVSSMQLDDKSRGFSFSDPEVQLDMRMDKNQVKSAYSVLNCYSQKQLEEVLKSGEEWHFRKIANAIVTERKNKPLQTVGDLLQILKKTLPQKYSKTHYATDTFRAIRLEVNGEISALSQTINEMVQKLNSGGRLAIITFHSLEDRIVKDTFRKIANPCTCPPQLPYCACGLTPIANIITKRPISPSQEEINSNPRARSAKLRIIERI